MPGFCVNWIEFKINRFNSYPSRSPLTSTVRGANNAARGRTDREIRSNSFLPSPPHSQTPHKYSSGRKKRGSGAHPWKAGAQNSRVRVVSITLGTTRKRILFLGKMDAEMKKILRSQVFIIEQLFYYVKIQPLCITMQNFHPFFYFASLAGYNKHNIQYCPE